MKIGEISTSRDGHYLRFFLDHKEVKRFRLEDVSMPGGPVYFNSSGLTAGGEIFVRLEQDYKIVVEEVSGKINATVLP